VQYAREIAPSKVAAIEKCGTKTEIADVWYDGNNYGRDRKYNARVATFAQRSRGFAGLNYFAQVS